MYRKKFIKNPISGFIKEHVPTKSMMAVLLK